MFCIYCGAELPDNAAYCNKCGKKQPFPEIETEALESDESLNDEDSMSEYVLYYDDSVSPKEVPTNNSEKKSNPFPNQLDEQKQPEDEMGANNPSQTHTQNDFAVNPDPPVGLKWHGFLTKILWVGIVGAVLRGLSAFRDAFLVEEYYELFNNYPALRVIEILFGLAMFAFAFYKSKTRIALVNFERRGPTMLYCNYALTVLLPVLYYVAYSITTNLSIFDFVEESQLWGSVIAAIVLIIINVIYYRKRQHLFGRLN